MNVIKTDIDGVVIIEPRIFEDSRGYFFESFSQREFDEKVAPIRFVQDNESKSSYGVMPSSLQMAGIRFRSGLVLPVSQLLIAFLWMPIRAASSFCSIPSTIL